MTTHRSRAAKPSSKVGAKKRAAGKAARATYPVPMRAQAPFSQDPRVLEAAYRAFERLSRPRYLN